MIYFILYVLAGLIFATAMQLWLHRDRVIIALERGLTPPPIQVREGEMVMGMAVIWPVVCLFIVITLIVEPIFSKLGKAYTAHLVKKHSKKQDNPEL